MENICIIVKFSQQITSRLYDAWQTLKGSCLFTRGALQQTNEAYKCEKCIIIFWCMIRCFCWMQSTNLFIVANWLQLFFPFIWEGEIAVIFLSFPHHKRYNCIIQVKNFCFIKQHGIFCGKCILVGNYVHIKSNTVRKNARLKLFERWNIFFGHC